MSPIPTMIMTSSQNGIIGQGTQRPWHFPEEMQRLERTIHKKPLIMGRKTFLQMRMMLRQCWVIVLSRDREFLREGSYRDYQGYGFWFVDKLEIAYTFANEFAKQHGQSEYFILGGAEVFHQTQYHVKRLYLTTLLQDYEGDHMAPDFQLKHWTQSYHEDNSSPAAQQDSPSHTFSILNHPDL